MKRILQLPVHVYRYVISPLFPPTCRFYPTCSDYCLQALEKHGALTGLWMSARRILRCHPWSGKHGIDLVPETHNLPEAQSDTNAEKACDKKTPNTCCKH